MSPDGGGAEAEREELRRRLHLFHSALETMQVGVTITDSEQRIVYVNPAEAALHGCTREELIGADAASFAPPPNRRRLSRDQLREVTSWQRETVNLRKDGTSFPVELLSDVVLDERGEPVGMVTICQDISERKHRERALVESRERYGLAIRGSNDAIWDWDLEAGTIHFSERWQEMLGLHGEPPSSTLVGWLDRVHAEDVVRLRARLDDHLAGRSEHFESEHRVLHADGSYRWILARGVALRDAAGTARRMGGSLTDITTRKVRDPLTDLPNRALLADRLSNALARQARGPGGVAVVFLDLDRFKLVNDSLGHPQGDRVLVEVARRLEGCLRPGDTVARVGGDEFVLVLEEMADREQAERVVGRVHHALAQPVLVEGEEVFVTTSAGIAWAPDGGRHADDLLREADTAMYWAKAGGRGCTRHFAERMRDAAAAELRVASELRHALERDELVLRYQPIVAAADRRTVGFEALLRWRHPRHGLLPPRAFLGAAEETGLILPIGEWVRREACAQLGAWQRLAGGGSELFVSVNASPRELARPEFADRLLAVVADSGIDPAGLVVEVTEEGVLEQSWAPGALARLHEAGVRVAIDDFGTGYSSLSYLDRLEVDLVKIDRSFIEGIDLPHNRSELVRHVVRMAADLSIDVVAEGVERPSQIEHLVRYECGYLQGFALGVPMAAEEAGGLVSRAAARRAGAAAAGRGRDAGES